HNAEEVDIESLRTSQLQTRLLQSSVLLLTSYYSRSRQEVVFLDNEITFNEAIIEEREQGIREIQEQIGEVNEIFKDLAVLVNDQGMTSALTLITHKQQLHRPLLNSEKHLNLKEQTHLWYTLLTFQFYDSVFLAAKAKFRVVYTCCRHVFLSSFLGLFYLLLSSLYWSEHQTPPSFNLQA
ncbi:hypothetical protein HID58_045434, partial [Brassica napus]